MYVILKVQIVCNAYNSKPLPMAYWQQVVRLINKLEATWKIEIVYCIANGKCDLYLKRMSTRKEHFPTSLEHYFSPYYSKNIIITNKLELKNKSGSVNLVL